MSEDVDKFIYLFLKNDKLKELVAESFIIDLILIVYNSYSLIPQNIYELLTNKQKQILCYELSLYKSSNYNLYNYMKMNAIINFYKNHIKLLDEREQFEHFLKDDVLKSLINNHHIDINWFDKEHLCVYCNNHPKIKN